MELAEFLSREAVLCDVKAGSKKHVLQVLSEEGAAQTGLAAREIFDTVLQREKLGSTGVGNGIAIPHGKFDKLDKIVGVFAKVGEAVDFDALDDERVDLVFLLLAPESAGADHLKALSRIARVLRDPGRLENLRAAPDATALYAHLVNEPASNAA